MNTKDLILGVFFLSMLMTSMVFAVDSITYDFDDVNVLYAAEFTAKPIDGVDSSNTWISDIVRGEDSKRITVTYGVVELKRNGEVLVIEEFIKVHGPDGSKRFLLNSASYDYWEGTDKFSQIRSFFWSAKKLEGTNIIKDKTKPIYSTCFSRKFDENENRYSFFLSFSNDGEEHSQVCTEGTAEMMYEADVDIIEESGDATANTIEESGYVSPQSPEGQQSPSGEQSTMTATEQ